MASVANETEQAAKTGLIAQLATDAISGVNHRAFWIDDETGSTTEERDYPAISYLTFPAIPNGYRIAIYTVAQVLRIATHRTDDLKRATLVSIYESVRTALDSRDFAADFTTVGSSRVFDAVMIESSDVGISGNESYIELNLSWKICT